MLTAWINDNDTNKWSDGLSFVQFTKNTRCHGEILQSPYKAMFSVKAKKGIASSFLPGEQIANIETEEQLEEIANTSETKEQLEEIVKAYKKKFERWSYRKPYFKENTEEDQQPTKSSHRILTEKHEFTSTKRAAIHT